MFLTFLMNVCKTFIDDILFPYNICSWLQDWLNYSMINVSVYAMTCLGNSKLLFQVGETSLSWINIKIVNTYFKHEARLVACSIFNQNSSVVVTLT